MQAAQSATSFGLPMRKRFLFEPQWVNMNHGSFGTYPLSVRDALRGYQRLAEAAPDKYLRYQYVGLLDEARERVASLVHAPTEEIVFTANATTGLNTVLRNLTYDKHDVVIYFDTIYGAIERTLLSIKESNPHLSLRKIGFGQEDGYSLPCSHDRITSMFSQTIIRLTSEGYNVKAAVFDTMISMPGVRLPFEKLTEICKDHGVLSVIDGAHGVGQIAIDLSTFQPDFFISNLHKWLYTPRGCAVLYVPKRNQHLIRTTFPTSHGYIPPISDDSTEIYSSLPPSTKDRFVNLFEFVATIDNTPYYCVPSALDFRKQVCGGEDAIITYIRDIAQRGADLIADKLGTLVMDDHQQDPMTNTHDSSPATQKNSWTTGLRACAMSNVLLPIKVLDSLTSPSLPALKTDHWTTVTRSDMSTHIAWMHRTMITESNTYALVFAYRDQFWLRLSGQIYLELEDFERLVYVLRDLIERVGKGESLQKHEEKDDPLMRRIDHVDVERLGRMDRFEEP